MMKNIFDVKVFDQPRPHGHMSKFRLVFFRRDIWPWGQGWYLAWDATP